MIRNELVVSSRRYPSPNPHVILTEITYWSEGLRVKGLLAEPKKEGHYEGILYLRGGIQHVGMVRPSRIAQLAYQGFIVFAPYYRGNRGGEGRDTFAGEDRMDVYHAVDVLKAHSSIIKERIHLLSFSRGGIMSLWSAVMRDDLISAVTWAGVSDVVTTYYERKDLRRMMRRVIGGTPQNSVENYEQRNALGRIEEIEIPYLIIHGEKDQHVAIEQAYLLEKQLKAHNKKYTTMYFPNYTHYIRPQHNMEIVHQLCTWMKNQ